MAPQSPRNTSRRLKNFTTLVGCVVSLLGIVLLLSNLYALSMIHPFHPHHQQNKQNNILGHNTPPHSVHSVSNSAATTKTQRRDNGRPQSDNGRPQLPVYQKQPAVDTDGYSFHIVSSSGCNALQDWQSYAFFHQVMASGFGGNVTRVASCQFPAEADALRKLHEEQVHSKMSPQFRLHTTPDYSRIVEPKYNFFNKPLGIRHWMEHELGFSPNNTEQNNAAREKWAKTIIVILDPDQFLLRPFVRDMTNEAELFVDPKGYRVVDQGQPMAAMYGFGGDWHKRIRVKELLELSTTRNADTSGLLTWNTSFVSNHLAIGPPYVAVAPDMYEIVRTWADFVIPIQAAMKGGDFMAEMYAYSTAAAHLHLPHQMAKSFMISDPDSAEAEAWHKWIDTKLVTGKVDADNSAQVCSLTMSPIPHVFHFCQRYYLGSYFFSKYQVPKEPPDEVFLSCKHPLYQEPPSDVAVQHETAVTLDGNTHRLQPRDRLRMAFSLCQMLPRMNAAAFFYKYHHCDPSAANFSKVFIHETHEAKRQRKAREKMERANKL